MDPQLIAFLEERFRENRAYLEVRFERIDARFEQVDARFEQVDARFEQVDARFEQVDARFEQIETRLEHFASRFGQLETRLGQLELRFGQLEARFGQLEARVVQLEARFGQLEARFGELEARVGQLEARVGHLEARLDRVEEAVRQTLVLVEGLRHEVHLMAEGFLGLDEKLQRLHNENTAVFEQVRSWIEPAVRGLDTRVKVLEGRSDRMQLDVVEAVRRLLGRPPLEPALAAE